MNSTIVISKTKMSVTKNGKPINNIAKLAFDLLYYLALNKDKVVSRQELVNNVWDSTFVVDRTVDVHITKLRKKFSDNPDDSANNDLIRTVIRSGYQLIGNVVIDDDLSEQNTNTNSEEIMLGGTYKNHKSQLLVVLNTAESKFGKLVIFVKGGSWNALPVKEFTNMFKPYKPKDEEAKTGKKK